MSENNDYNETPIEEVEVKPTYEVLEALLVESNNDRDRYLSRTQSYEAQINRYQGRIGDAGNYIKDNIEDMGDHGLEVLELLGLPNTDTKTFKVTITALIEVEGKIGSDFELSEYDFDIDRLEISTNESGYEVVDHNDLEIIEVEED